MPDRLQFPRGVKGWRKPEGARFVTRATIFGNPWAVGVEAAFWWPRGGSGWVSTHPIPAGILTAETAVEAFRAWVEGYAIARDMRPKHLTKEGSRSCWNALAARRALIFARMPELRGLDLVCTCKPGACCHADVLLELCAIGGSNA